MRISTRPISIGMRVTLWYVTTLFAILVAYAAAVYIFVSASKAAELDAQLHRDYELVAEALYFNAAGDLTWRPQQHFHAESTLDPEPFVELRDANGKLAFSRGDALLPILQLPPQDPRAVGYTNLAIRGVRLRALQENIVVDGRPYRARIIRSAEQGHRALRSLMVWSFLVMPIGLALAAAAGYAVARRALNPVAQMTTEARRISAEKLSARLPIVNPDDELGRLAATFNAAFERIEQSFEQLRAFTADAAHELRTPLAALRAVGENALAGPHDLCVYRDVIGSMLEECERLTTLVNRLLLLARADQGRVVPKMRSVDLCELAAQATGLLRAAAEEKGQQVVENQHHHVMAEADPGFLLQVVLNIVDNAIRHTPVGTTIEVDARADGADAFIEVRDDGPGIAAEEHERIFDRFYRADASRSRGDESGFGLGLAVARALIAAQSGRIEVESSPGHGTTFRIVLPAPPKDKTCNQSAETAAPTMNL